MIYKVITGRLFNHDDFTNIVGDKLYPVIIPQTRNFPAVTYSITTSNPEQTKDRTKCDNITFQVDIYSNSYEQAHDITQIIRDRLHQFYGIVNDVESKVVLTSFADGAYTEELDLFNVRMEFEAKLKL
jgi:hypothetical protein